MIDDRITVTNEVGQSFDKMQIALAIRNSTFDDEMSCSLLENRVINNCEGCSLNYICSGVDEIVEDYREKTTKVISSFSFE